MTDEFKHFCDNMECPNHSLELNDERHYHTGTDGCVGGICGILQTHSYPVEVKTNYRDEGALFRQKFVYDIEKKVYHFCDICNSMIKIYKSIKG